MNITLKESKRLLKWFDVAVECGNLTDADLKLYDKIRENIEEDEDSDDPLIFNPVKKSKDTYTYEEEEEEELDEDDSDYGRDDYSDDEDDDY